MAAHNQASSLVVACSSGEGESPPSDAALWMSEIELMKAVNIWRVEEGRITRVPGCSDERLDAQPARRSTENTKTKVVVLTGREEFPNEN